MKPLHESSNLSSQLSNLKASLTFWDDLISKSNKLTASVSISMQCLSGFLEAFQKISDIAETNNAGLRPFGIALRRYCLRQRCVESRLRGLNSQITECLVTPLSERLDEWRRTSSQMDRDYVKELRKAKSELQRATLEAEKCKKRLRRKQERGGVTTTFEKDDLEAPNVQINFVQHDLAHKHRALERLEQRCLEAVAVEERRRFAELSTCLNPLLDAQMSVLEELGPLEEALKEIRAAQPAVVAADTSTSTDANNTFHLRSTPLVKAGVASSQNFVSKANKGNRPLDATIATGSAALSFAVAPAPSTLSITSTSMTGNGCSNLFGYADSVATLHSPDEDEVARMYSPPSQLSPTRHGCAGSPDPTESLVNDARGGGMGGDALSLFDHNQSVSGAPTVNSASSCSSLGLLPINCDAVSTLESMTNSTSPNAHGDISVGNGPFHAKRLSNNNVEEGDGEDEEEEEDGGTTEGCLTEDDENEETLDAGLQSQKPSSVATATAATSTVSAAMEKSILYPNQSLPPPVYTNIGKLQAAAQRGVGTAPKDPSPPTSTATSNGQGAENPSLGGLMHSAFDAQSEGRKFSQPTATILNGGMASLLRSLSISGRSGFVPSRSPPSTQLGLEDCEGAGEGLSLSPPQTSSMTPIIADQALLHQTQPPSAPNSPSSTYFEARSHTDAIFSNTDVGALSREWTGFRPESPSPTIESLVSEAGTDAGGTLSGGAGIAAGFCRRRLQQQMQSQQRNNLMRGSMIQLNTKSTSLAADAMTPMDIDRRYGYGAKQAPMTPGPGRRAPLRTPPSTLNETGQVIRPPRRSSSVCRELPSLCNQQQQQQQFQHFFPSPGSLSQVEHQQQNLNNGIHYAAPRGVQQHPKCVYADPRAFQHSQHQLQQPNVSAVSAITTATAAQLAAEAAAARRHQQLASPSGLCNSMTQRATGHMQNGSTQSRLPQRQTAANANSSSTGVSTRANNPRAVFVQQQQQQQQIGITPTSGAPLYGCSSQQYGHNHQQQQQHPNHQNINYLHKQQQLLHHEYPPPPAAFDDVESTSFIESPAPTPLQ